MDGNCREFGKIVLKESLRSCFGKMKLSEPIIERPTDKKGMQPLFGAKYPDFRFFCPECSSLEVFISWQANIPKGHCIECNNDWSEGIRA